LWLERHRQYLDILQRVKGGARLLDVGCCVAQDLRKLVLDGAPASNLWGLELNPAFVEYAFDLFGDRDTFKAHFITGVDVMDVNNAELKPLEGSVDICQVNAFLHLWDLEGQKRVCERLVQLMTPAPGALIVGKHIGRVDAQEVPTPVSSPGVKTMFQHNEESFAKMWEEVGRSTGTKWKVSAELLELGPTSVFSNDTNGRLLIFEAEKLE